MAEEIPGEESERPTAPKQGIFVFSNGARYGELIATFLLPKDPDLKPHEV